MKVNLESKNLSFRLGTSGFLAAILSLGSLALQSANAQAPIVISAPQPRQIVVATGDPLILANHTPSKVLDGTAFRVDHYTPENKLRLALGLQSPHLAEAEQFTRELTTKGSPNFHKFLTQDEWNVRFAPSVEDEQKVVDWAESRGLTVTRRYPNRLLVDVEAPAGVIEKALGVTINKYQVGDEVDFSNDRDPVIPASLSGILQTVAGLDNIERLHRIGSRYKTVKGADYAPGPAYAAGESSQGGGQPKESGLVSGLKANDSFPLDDKNGTYAADPDSIQSSEGYDYNAFERLSHCCNVHNDTTGSPAVSSIALVGYGAYNYSDVTTFFGAYTNSDNIGGCYMEWNLSNIYVDGSSPAVDGEAPLDVEYAGAMSNSCGFSNSGKEVNTAHIYEYEMADNSWATYEDAFNDIVKDAYAKVVSTSYGGSEALSGTSNSMETGTMHTIFLNMVDAGWTLIAASGDNGSSDGCGDATIVDWPASDPSFLAAGGTQLSLTTAGIYQSEIGWQGEFWTNAQNNGNGGACANNHGGSTGGVSQLFTAPSWQSSLVSPYYEYKTVSGVTTEYKVTGNTMRLVPDMALTANPDVMGEWYYATVPPATTGSWQDEGGTSIVAPELAGFFAQFNTYLNYIGNICGSGTDACTPVGLPAPFLYDNALVGAAHYPFYDMLSGCSDNDITVQDDLVYYCAAPGFDLVTGWGSANMLQLAWGINYNLIPAYGEPVITFSGPTTNTWYNSDQEISWSVTSINTRSGGTTPPPGVAGFTQGWDSIPADPYSEPHGGAGNSFYNGPQYAFGTTGCLSFDGLNGCASASSPQGCHTVNVEAWDNQGDPVTDTFGPVCYDTVAPTISASTNPTTSGSVWVDKSVTVTLTANDPGGSNASGIYKTYYAINTGSCYPGSISSCSVYTGPFTVSTAGQSYIYYFTEDNAGNYSLEPYIWVSIDETKPVTTASLSGTISSGTIYKTAVQITLSATDSGGSGVANTYYELDGGAQTSYSTPITVSALGSHTIKYWSVSGSGETEATKTTSFSIASPTTATLVATPNPSKLGQSVTMTATVTATLSGTPTGTVTFYNGATNLGTGTLSGGVATLSTTALPAGNLTLQVSYPATGNFLATNSAPFDQTVYGAPAVLTTPAPSSALTGSSVKFTWSASPAATGYILALGSTGVGSTNLYYSGSTTATSVTATDLPTNGETIYARLFTNEGGTYVHNDYTYTAVTQAALTAPTPGSTLTSSSTTFSWTTVTGATGYLLSLGSTGVGSTNLYYSGSTTNTSATVNGLPINGETIYARLFTNNGGTWLHTDYTYKAVTEAQAVLTTPAPSGTLAGSSVTFSWTAAPSATGYILSLGSTGAGSTNLYYSGSTTATSVNVTGLPINGETIYARLFTQLGGSWVHTDYTYTAATEAQAVLTTPTPGTTLAGASVTFTWTSAPSATGYILALGSTGAGATNLYYSGATTATSVTVTKLPTNGETIYARLFTQLGGTWVHTDYTYTAQ